MIRKKWLHHWLNDFQRRRVEDRIQCKGAWKKHIWGGGSILCPDLGEVYSFMLLGSWLLLNVNFTSVNLPTSTTTIKKGLYGYIPKQKQLIVVD